MKPLCNANIEVLQQLEELIDLCSHIYLKEADSLHAGIGQHVRHVLDHYRAFQQGIEAKKIDYNLRNRNCIEETKPTEAIASTREMIAWFEQMPAQDDDITVVSEISLREMQCQQMASNVSRELLYLINHSIHHMAYASLLASTQGVTLPRHIGLAPGTATFERKQKTGATHD